MCLVNCSDCLAENLPTKTQNIVSLRSIGRSVGRLHCNNSLHSFARGIYTTADCTTIWCFERNFRSRSTSIYVQFLVNENNKIMLVATLLWRYNFVVVDYIFVRRPTTVVAAEYVMVWCGSDVCKCSHRICKDICKELTQNIVRNIIPAIMLITSLCHYICS